MLGDQGISKQRNPLLHFVAAIRVESQIAFGIESHGAVAEIGRADAHQPVIHNQKLRMD